MPEEPQRAFGRLHAPDSRDLAFSIAAVTEAPADLPMAKHWTTGALINQGDFPHCVEYAWRQWLATSPVRNKWPRPAKWLYDECQLNDEWPGQDYEGTSVRAGAKVLRREGYIKTYGWAFDAQTVASFVLTQGPMVLGTDWFSGMSTPDSSGFIQARGRFEGGHSYLVKGIDRTKRCPDGTVGCVRIVNSWGPYWGQWGHAWISLEDLQVLMELSGEACSAVELKVQL